MQPDRILYTGAVDELSSSVGTTAGSLQSIKDDIANQTESVAEFFQGGAATAFRENQLMMLSALQDLIDVMSQHGAAIGFSAVSARATDRLMSQGFG